MHRPPKENSNVRQPAQRRRHRSVTTLIAKGTPWCASDINFGGAYLEDAWRGTLRAEGGGQC